MAKTLNDATIRRLSAAQREMLMAHVDGWAPIVVVSGKVSSRKTRRALIDLGLLFLVRGRGAINRRPRKTKITDEGRRVLGIILGDQADQIARAQARASDAAFDAGEAARTLNALQKLREFRSQTNPAKSPNRKNSTNSSSSEGLIGRCSPAIDSSLAMISSGEAPASYLADSVKR